MHISAQRIESYPREYGSWSCDKGKLSIRLEAQKLKRAVIFYLLAISAETAYLSFRDQDLSNGVRLVEFRRRKVVVHTFCGWSQAGLLRQPSCRNYRKPQLFVSGPIVVKFHIPTRLSESLLMMHRFWKCSQEQLHFTPVHTLCQLKCDEALIPPLRRVVEVRARYG